MSRILCIEDSAEVQLVLNRVLAVSHQVEGVPTLALAREALNRGEVDLIILDIGLPDGDGLEFCSELKLSEKFQQIPLFVLTAKQSIEEKTLGFQLGIEDFIVKPFHPIELRARVESRLKKIAAQQISGDLLVAGDLRFQFSTQRVTHIGSEPVVSFDFSTTEFKILSILAKNPDQIKTREQIITAVWGNGFHLSDRTVDSHISRIRKKLSVCRCSIEAVVQSGYRFVVVADKSKRVSHKRKAA